MHYAGSCSSSTQSLLSTIRHSQTNRTSPTDYFSDTLLDKESKQYADTAIIAVVSNWDQRQLLDRASPYLVKSIDAQGVGTLDALFQQWQRLGSMAKYGGAKGEANMS